MACGLLFSNAPLDYVTALRLCKCLFLESTVPYLFPFINQPAGPKPCLAPPFLIHSVVLAQLLKDLGGRKILDESIAPLLMLDPVLALRALEAYAQSHSGQSLQFFRQADLLQGLDASTLKSIATTGATDRFTHLAYANRHATWLPALRCAVLSRMLAEKLHYPSPDEAWLAGLLIWLPGFAAASDLAPDLPRQAAQAALDQLPLRTFMPDVLRYRDLQPERLLDAAPLVQMVVSAYRLAQMSLSEVARKTDNPLLNVLFMVSRVDQETLRDLLTLADQQVNALAAKYRLEQSSENSITEKTISDKAIADLGLELIRYNQLELAASAMQENQSAAILTLARLLASHEGLADPIYLKLNARSGFLEAQPLGEHPFAPLSIRVEGSNTAAVRAMLTRTAMIVLEDAGMDAAVLDLQLIRQADADGLVAIPVGEADSQGVLLVCGNAVALAAVAALPKHFARMGELAGRLPPTSGVIGSENSIDEPATALPSLVRRAAHEINNPLGIIKNYLAILKVKLGDDAPISDELRIIYEELDRIVRIVRGLSRAPVESATVREAADLNALIQDLVKVTQPTWMNKGIEVSTVLSPGLAHLTKDRDKLKQIVLNLMLNAIEATPPGGVVRIETAALLNQRHEHFIEVLVSDSGSGIAPDIAKQIFDPLDTAKGDGHAGLGLSIVKSLTESMQGSIIFKTSATGTTFQILLPTN